jgi:ABC-type Zn uptake system ZnuABC Zn-binding protein ZnuA
LKKLGYFKDNESYNIDGVSVKANSEEDASEIKDIIDVFKVSSNRIVGYKEETPEDLLNSIRNEVNKVQKIEVPTNIEDSLYDVRLPDGTVLINQTDDDLEELKKVYNIVLGQIDELSRNIE